MPTYAQIYKTAMKERAPRLFQYLKSRNLLEKQAEVVEEEIGREVEEAILNERRRLVGQPYMETVRRLDTARRVAEEMAISYMTQFPLSETVELDPDREVSPFPEIDHDVHSETDRRPTSFSLRAAHLRAVEEANALDIDEPKLIVGKAISGATDNKSERAWWVPVNPKYSPSQILLLAVQSSKGPQMSPQEYRAQLVGKLKGLFSDPEAELVLYAHPIAQKLVQYPSTPFEMAEALMYDDHLSGLVSRLDPKTLRLARQDDLEELAQQDLEMFLEDLENVYHEIG